MKHLIDNAEAVREFLLAGNSTFTLVSTKTSTRYTYRVRRAKGEDESRPWFVALLTGSDNESSYSYIGCLFPRDPTRFCSTKGSRLPSTATPVKAVTWYLTNVGTDKVEFWHEGRCGRCGRKLTVPESISSGLGPICRTAA